MRRLSQILLPLKRILKRIIIILELVAYSIAVSSLPGHTDANAIEAIFLILASPFHHAKHQLFLLLLIRLVIRNLRCFQEAIHRNWKILCLVQTFDAATQATELTTINQVSAKSCDEIGRIAAKLCTTGKWTCSEIPRSDMVIKWRSCIK